MCKKRKWGDYIPPLEGQGRGEGGGKAQGLLPSLSFLLKILTGLGRGPMDNAIPVNLSYSLL